MHYGTCDDQQGKDHRTRSADRGAGCRDRTLVTADADCAETLHLVAAVRGAVAGLMDELVGDHLHAHVAAPGLSDEERTAARHRACQAAPPPFPLKIADEGRFAVNTHSHDYLGHAHDENARRTRLVVWLSTGMMVGEIVAGYLTGSMALLADGFHMATHVGALGIAAIAYSYAKRHVANPRYSWGTGKVGELAGFGSAMVLGLVSLGIAYESIMRLADPHAVAFGDAIFVAVLGLLVNVASAWLLGHGIVTGTITDIAMGTDTAMGMGMGTITSTFA